MNGQKSGKGTQTWSDGSKYTGDFKNDTRNGKGTFIYASGSKGKYIGEWSNGKRNGHGTFIWAKDGNIYVGRWKDDARNGKGKTTFTDGTIYEGFFRGSKFIEGVFKDKFFREGVYKNGTFNYTSDRPTKAEMSPLKAAFIKLSATQRKLIQTVLSELRFYGSSIDSLYGKGTAAALVAYNKQYLNGADLSKISNVSKLITAILTLKTSHTKGLKSAPAGDYFTALKELKPLAEQGNAKAQYNLGLMYEFSSGVLQDNITAHMWYNIASANGHEKAGERRDERAGLMTAEDISKATAMARECTNSGYKKCGY